eukprot:31197-Pelagococcus_subviridis.AAC.13
MRRKKETRTLSPFRRRVASTSFRAMFGPASPSSPNSSLSSFVFGVKNGSTSRCSQWDNISCAFDAPELLCPVDDEHPGALSDALRNNFRAALPEDGVRPPQRLRRRRDHGQIHRLHEPRTRFQNALSNRFPRRGDDLPRERTVLILPRAVVRVLAAVRIDFRKRLQDDVHAEQRLFAQRSALGRHLKPGQRVSLDRGDRRGIGEVHQPALAPARRRARRRRLEPERPADDRLPKRADRAPARTVEHLPDAQHVGTDLFRPERPRGGHRLRYDAVETIVVDFHRF